MALQGAGSSPIVGALLPLRFTNPEHLLPQPICQQFLLQLPESLFFLSGKDFQMFYSWGNGGLQRLLTEMFAFEKEDLRTQGNRVELWLLCLCHCWLGAAGSWEVSSSSIFAGTQSPELGLYLPSCLASMSAGQGQGGMTCGHTPGHQQRDQGQRLALVHNR